jgi:hypothetical protein
VKNKKNWAFKPFAPTQAAARLGTAHAAETGWLSVWRMGPRSRGAVAGGAFTMPSAVRQGRFTDNLRVFSADDEIIIGYLITKSNKFVIKKPHVSVK